MRLVFLWSQTECGGDGERSSLPVAERIVRGPSRGSGSFMGRDLWERVGQSSVSGRRQCGQVNSASGWSGLEQHSLVCWW